EIENVVTTNDELYRAFTDDADRTDPATKEVLRYEDALWHGYAHLQRGGRLDTGLFLELVRIIKQQELPIRRISGTQIGNAQTGDIIYTPPVGEDRLRGLLENLTDYFDAADDLDPLIKLAVAHYQFEAIHPFPDGNGRTGRVLNILLLLYWRRLDLPILYLSQAIIRNKSAYYAGLRQVTEDGAWEPWILYMLDAVEQTARDTRLRLERVRTALREAIDDAKARMVRGYSKELIELIFEQPYTRISTLERAEIAKRDAASNYLRELERIGLLQSRKYGREVLYLNRRLMELLSV
ncbi:MAG: Fic family protein, partial [Fimbriimonadaceae bacterium]|nr:Fic family protein [Fimbriimonadaceae bacterium]